MAVIEGTATVVSVVDPAVSRLVDALPTMRNGKPRRFRLYCECFEWTFNHQRRREKELNFIPPPVAEFVEHVDILAGAIWHHQNPRAAA